MRNRKIYLLLIITVLICHFLRNLDFSYYPDSAKKVISVKIEMEGAGPEDIEKLLCNPLEEEILLIPGIRTISSKSEWENCEILLFLDDRSDMNRIYIELRELIDRKSLLFPPAAGKGVIRKSSSLTSPVFIFIPELIKSDEIHKKLTQWSEEKVRTELQGINGISQIQVSSSSGQDLNIKFDTERLTSIGRNAMDLAAVLHRHNQIGSYDLNESNPVILDQRLRSVPDVMNIPLNHSLPLSNLSDIKIGAPDSKKISKLNGQRQTMVWIYGNGDANTIDLCRQLRQASSNFPEHLVLYDKGKLIEDALKEIFIILLLSILAVIIITVFLLKDRKSALPVCLNIPFSTAGTLAILNMASVEINILVLGALALCSGMIIDNGIIVLEQGYDKSKKALYASLLSTLLVLSPFLFASPRLKILCSPLIVSLSICLTLSLVFIILTMSDYTGRPLKLPSPESVNQTHEKSLIIRKFRPVAILSLVCLTIPVFIMLLKLEYSHEFKLLDNSIRFFIEFPAGSLKESIEKKLQNMDAYVLKMEGIDFYSSEYEDEKATFNIRLSKNQNKEILEKRIRKKMESHPGFLHFENNDSEDTYTVRVITHNRDLLYKETEKIAAILKKNIKNEEIVLHYKKQLPLLKVQTDNFFCMITGSTPAAIAQELSHYLSPPVLGKWIPPGGPVYDIRIFDKESIQLEASTLGKFKIHPPADLALENMSEITDQENYGPIEHHNTQRSISFSFSSDKAGNKKISKIIDETLDEYPLPDHVRIIHGEQYSSNRKNAGELVKLLTASLLLLFLLLVFLFESPFLPFFMIGQIIICHIFTLAFLSLIKINLSVPVFFGLVLNTGLSINNSLIAYSGFKSGRPSLNKALNALMQCRTTILTAACTTLTGFIPFLIAGESSAELLKALSLTVGSSIIISITVLYLSLTFLEIES